MRTRTRLAAPLVGLAWALVACGGSGGDRAGRFCAEVKADQPTITATVADPSAVDHVVDRFHDLEQTAPLAIEDDWRVLTQLVETAAAIAPGDAEARTRLVTAAYEADRSVQNVVGWVRSVCGVDLTLPAIAASTTPTIAPATTAPAASG
jgi:hypothetical protein